MVPPILGETFMCIFYHTSFTHISLFYFIFIFWFHNFTIRYESKHTNLGRLMEKHGSELLGPLYKDPITSYNLFQKFSVQHPEVSICFVSQVYLLIYLFESGSIKRVVVTWFIRLIGQFS